MFFDFNAMIIGGSVKAAKLFLYKISQDFNPDRRTEQELTPDGGGAFLV